MSAALGSRRTLGRIADTAWSGLATRTENGLLPDSSAAPGVPGAVLPEWLTSRQR